MTKEYIGDGVYADFDGWQIELSTDRGNGQETIYLEPAVWESLYKYAERIRKAHLTAHETEQQP